MNLTATNIEEMTLSFSRDFNTTREKLFQAWTEPTLFKRWFGPEGVTTTDAEMDLRVGGKYQFTMLTPDGSISHHGGEYRVIDPPRKLVFTWILDGQHCEGSQDQYAETVVTLDFEDKGTSTGLILTHELLPSEESKEAHSQGWRGCLDSLARSVD